MENHSKFHLILHGIHTLTPEFHAEIQEKIKLNFYLKIHS